MMKRFALLLAGFVLALGSPSCGSNEGELQPFSTGNAACSPGDQQPCECETGSFSVQSCKNDGSWDACDCSCGNGDIDPGEECDGKNLKGENCAMATMNAEPAGTLACKSNCTFDTSGCNGSLGGGGTFGGGTLGGGGTVGGGGTIGGGGALGN